MIEIVLSVILAVLLIIIAFGILWLLGLQIREYFILRKMEPRVMTMSKKDSQRLRKYMQKGNKKKK